MKARKIITKIALVLLAIVVLLGATGLFYFKSFLPTTVAKESFPQTSGEITLSGLNAPVKIYRDQMGIPQIYASSAHDLFFAQGYVHAQDRFWQMDAWRHIGSATLSEMFGKGQVETDAFLRTLGWRQTAEAEWQGLDQDSKNILLAYTDGVNAYLKDHSGTALSLEYAVLKLLSPNYRVAEWTPVNSLTWGKAMAWDLRGNMDEEIERVVLLKTLTPEQVDELFPPYPQDHPVIVNQIEDNAAKAAAPVSTVVNLPASVDLASTAENISRLNQVLGALGDGIGSNSWVISGERTATGMPLLANDPHLGIQMPSIWYQVGMHCEPQTADCPYEMAGFSFAGVPGVVIGHNDRVAWGFTNVGPDVMDLYIEKVNPDNPNQYEVNGSWVDFETRDETIAVAGGDPVTITVRTTRHGPVISDTFGPVMDSGDPKDKEFVPFKEKAGIDLPEQYVVALKWTALSPSTPFKAIWGFDKAQNWEDFRAAAANFHVPAQNLIYADVDGNIGYQMPGDIPVRAGGDGRLPVPGWTDAYEWTGFLPFEKQPYLFNPSSGYIVTANNQVPPRDYPYFVSSDWDYGFRANRIVSLIETAQGPIDIAYIQKMQGDNFDANAPVFVPLLLASAPASLTANEKIVLEQLKNWDYMANADSTPAAFFEAFWRHLLQGTFNDELPKAYQPDGGSRWNEVMRNLSSDSPWWDDKSTTSVVESRGDIIAKAITEAFNELEKTYGKDPANWKWGNMHAATFKNQTLGESGIGLIEDLFNRGPFPVGGGLSVVNATGWSVKNGYETDWLPSMRMIVDLSNLSNSVTVHTTGQSGHAGNPHYTDMAPLWASLQYYPMLWDKEQVLANQAALLTLKP